MADASPQHDPALSRFNQRCHTLGATLWRYHRSHGLAPVTHDAPGAQWLAGDAMRVRLEKQLDLASANLEPIEELDTDLFAVILDDGQHSVIALMLGESAGQGAGFNEDASAAGFHPASVLQEMGQVSRYSVDQLRSLRKTMSWSLRDLRQLDEQNTTVDDLTDQLSHSYENITLLYRMGRTMSNLQSPGIITQSICSQLRDTQDFGWVAAQFRHDEESVPELDGQHMLVGEMPCSPEAFRRASESLLEQLQEDSWSKLLQVGEHELADLAGSEVILDPIHHDGRVVGVVMAGGKTGDDAEATSNDTQLVDAIASFLGTFHENAARFHEQRNMFIGTLEAVSAALDAKDRYTRGHSERVAYLATLLAEAIGLDEQEIERLRISGLVHDVGKIGVPEAVLGKTGRLTDKEFEKIKKHPRIGYNILKGIPKMQDVLDGVLYHHERWDGRGYPDKLAGEAIPLYGRILAVCDTFDAMSSTRSYRQAMGREEVLEEILRCAGSQFDPALTGPFVGLDFSFYDEMVTRHQQSANEQGQASQAA
ncbi:MAG: HD-GYP domain-containing protein [Planctomycetota bacterium]